MGRGPSGSLPFADSHLKRLHMPHRLLTAFAATVMLCGQVVAHPIAGIDAGPSRRETVSCVSTVSEFNTALANAVPGSEIVLCDGEWRDVELRFYGERSANGIGGTSVAPIVLRASTPGGVRLTGSSRLRIEGPNMHVDGLFFDGAVSTGHALVEFRKDSDELAHDSVLRNVAMIGCNPADDDFDYKWVSIYGTGNRVEDCTFGERTHRGVTLTVWLDGSQPPSSAVIEGCHFYGRTPGSGNGFETIRIGTSDTSMLESNVIVRGNLFEECDGEIELISSKSVGNQFLHNTFRRNRGQLTLRHGSDCVVDGSFFLGEGISNSSGVRIVGPRHVVTNNYFENLQGTGTRAAIALMNGVPDSPLNRYLPIEDVTIAYNTIVNCREPFSIGNTASEGDTTVAPADSLVANNVVLGSTGPLIRIITPPVNFTWAGNIMTGGAIGYTPALSGTTLTDPMLSVSDDGMYRPKFGSPLIDTADPILLVPHDMDGQRRQAGLAADIGADEVSTAPILHSPLQSAQVGAKWLRPILTIDSWWVQ